MMKEENPVAATTEVPEASPESNAADASDKELTKSPPSRAAGGRRGLYLALGIAAVIAATLCIVLPLTLVNKDNGSSSNKSNTVSTANSVPSSPTSISYSNNNDTTTTTTTIPTDSTTATATTMMMNGDNSMTSGATIVASKAAFITVDGKQMLPLYGPGITNGYASPEELQSALTIALRNQAGNVIQRKIQEQGMYGGYIGKETMVGATVQDAGGAAEGDQAMMAESSTANGAAAASPSANAEQGVTDFDTNNQEENVDEADIVKADANFVYGAFGDYILVWDTAGKQVAQVAMPPIDLPDNWGQPYQDGVVGKQTVDSASSMPVWIPKPYINAMLLTDSHLIAVVNGYHSNYYWGPYPADASAIEPHILSDYQASQIRVYEKSATGALTFVGMKDVNGQYIDARSIGNVVHLATGTMVDMYTHLWAPLDRFNFGENITNEEYQIQAMQLAEEKLIPTIARKLVEELQTSTDGGLPNMLQINQWMTEFIDEDSLNNNETYTVPFDQYDVISNVATVTSFDVTQDLVNEQLNVATSSYMAPHYFSTLYGTTDTLILATSGYDWDPVKREQTQTTYLVALNINDDATTSFLAVGNVQGHLLNQYALDVKDNELRAATTVQHQWWWWWGRPMPMMMEGDVAEAASVTAEAAQAADQAIWTPAPTTDESNTENYMTVLTMTGGATQGKMEKKGDVQIGEKNERITAIRFFDNVAYAVTFERTDPFYVLDMSVPKILGELKLPGFSSYLHPMNADNTLLLAVGQNATDEGTVTGLMITVFDATTPASPKALVSHTFENSQDSYSSSSVEWDYKAFRYVDGKLIIPVDIWYSQVWDDSTQQLLPLPEGVENFQGFAVMNVNTTAISEAFRVSHMRAPGTCSYCSGYLPTRSFVYSGDLMTVRDSTVVSTNMATGQEVWRLPLTVEGEKAECCW